MTASAWDKFLLLSWKNWVIQIRHPIQTVFEVLIPVLVCTLIIVVRGLVDISESPELRYQPINTNLIGEVLSYSDTNTFLGYSPSNPVLAALVGNAATQLGLSVRFGAENASALETWAMNQVPFASIEFDDSYKVSWRIDRHEG